MTIDGTNISTYGLRLIAMDGYYSQPARKKILSEPVFTSGSIKFEAKECVVTLYGEYASLALMYTGIEAFKTKVQTAIEHTFILIAHGLIFTGVVADGIKTEVINKAVKLTVKINVTE